MTAPTQSASDSRATQQATTATQPGTGPARWVAGRTNSGRKNT